MTNQFDLDRLKEHLIEKIIQSENNLSDLEDDPPDHTVNSIKIRIYEDLLHDIEIGRFKPIEE